MLKRYIGLATLDAAHAAPGTALDLEPMVEHARRRVPAVVVRKPFYDPPQKRA